MIPLGPVVARSRVRAPRAAVWATVVDPELRQTWWPELHLEPRLGGAVAERWTETSGDAAVTRDASGDVDVWVEGHAIGFRWSEAGDDHSTAVLVTLRSQGPETGITVTETGFDVLPSPAERAAASQDGWQVLLTDLVASVEAAVAAGSFAAAVAEASAEASAEVVAEPEAPAELDAEAEATGDVEVEAEVDVDADEDVEDVEVDVDADADADADASVDAEQNMNETVEIERLVVAEDPETALSEDVVTENAEEFSGRSGDEAESSDPAPDDSEASDSETEAGATETIESDDSELEESDAPQAPESPEDSDESGDPEEPDFDTLIRGSQPK